MRVVTTSHKAGFDLYGQRWLDSRKHWPDAEFIYYTEGFDVDCPSKDLALLPALVQFKAKHAGYVPPSWQWDVVRYSNKVFAAIDALTSRRGIGVWLDADCVTFKPIPPGLIEKQVDGVYLAHYGRTGSYTETGLWIMDCSHPKHAEFLQTWKGLYLSERYKQLPQWHDCFTLDAAIRLTGVPTFNLSGEHAKKMHPQAYSELGQFIDHQKGQRKHKDKSPENKFR